MQADLRTPGEALPPLELRLARLEQTLRRLRCDLEHTELLLGTESSLLQLLDRSQDTAARHEQLLQLFYETA